MKKRDQDRAEANPWAAALKDQGKVMRIKANIPYPKKYPIMRSITFIQPGLGSREYDEAQFLKKMQNICTDIK